MKFIASSLVLLAASAHGFRDQKTKKDPELQARRKLEQVCTIDHDVAQTPVTEKWVHVQTYPEEKDGLFDVTLAGPPYAPEGKNVTVPAWCIDYDRFIWTGDFKMDIFSAFDSDLHTDAVELRQNLPNVAWLINNINVDDVWPASEGCDGGAIDWMTLQNALWMLVDGHFGEGSWGPTLPCVAEGIAARALAEGNNYEPDCTDPNEQIPLVFVVDEGEGDAIQNQVIMSETLLSSVEGMCKCEDDDKSFQAPPKTASSSGDPHFRTWSGDKFDYHGECDLVLVDNPSFADGLGLKVHIRTTRIKYFSYIESIAVQIGDETLEFSNDVENFKLNGTPAEPIRKYVETKLAGFVVRRDPKALSIRLNKEDYQHPGAKIDLIQRSIGFPAVVLDGFGTDIFQGSLGLLGDWSTGKKIARDGETVLEDATEFALEWQVRDSEPMIFSDARYPQFPTQCTPPKQMMGNRLGQSHMREEAEKACASWAQDKEDCIFDVIATRDIMSAEGGSVVA